MGRIFSMRRFRTKKGDLVDLVRLWRTFHRANCQNTSSVARVQAEKVSLLKQGVVFRLESQNVWISREISREIYAKISRDGTLARGNIMDLSRWHSVSISLTSSRRIPRQSPAAGICNLKSW